MVLKAKSKIRLNIVLNALQKESEGEAQKRQFLLVAPLNSTVQELKRRILTMANQVSQEKLKRFNQVASSTPIHKKKLLFIEKEIKISTIIDPDTITIRNSLGSEVYSALLIGDVFDDGEVIHAFGDAFDDFNFADSSPLLNQAQQSYTSIGEKRNSEFSPMDQLGKRPKLNNSLTSFYRNTDQDASFSSSVDDSFINAFKSTPHLKKCDDTAKKDALVNSSSAVAEGTSPTPVNANVLDNPVLDNPSTTSINKNDVNLDSDANIPKEDVKPSPKSEKQNLTVEFSNCLEEQEPYSQELVSDTEDEKMVAIEKCKTIIDFVQDDLRNLSPTTAVEELPNREVLEPSFIDNEIVEALSENDDDEEEKSTLLTEFTEEEKQEEPASSMEPTHHTLSGLTQVTFSDKNGESTDDDSSEENEGEMNGDPPLYTSEEEAVDDNTSTCVEAVIPKKLEQGTREASREVKPEDVSKLVSSKSDSVSSSDSESSSNDSEEENILSSDSESSSNDSEEENTKTVDPPLYTSEKEAVDDNTSTCVEAVIPKKLEEGTREASREAKPEDASKLVSSKSDSVSSSDSESSSNDSEEENTKTVAPRNITTVINVQKPSLGKDSKAVIRPKRRIPSLSQLAATNSKSKLITTNIHMEPESYTKINKKVQKDISSSSSDSDDSISNKKTKSKVRYGGKLLKKKAKAKKEKASGFAGLALDALIPPSQMFGVESQDPL